jgi:hypothetical protein
VHRAEVAGVGAIAAVIAVPIMMMVVMMMRERVAGRD